MILGLTGAIGCGKSTACSYFAQKGWRLFDADKSCHALYRDINAPLGKAIRDEWGAECFNGDGTLNRQVLAERVFTSDSELEKLTQLIYPALFEAMEKEIAAARAANVNMLCEVPLLFECETEKYFDMTCTVWSGRELRHSRLRKFRNFTDEDIGRREARQWSAEKKLEAADVAFINNGGPEFLYRQIDDFIKEHV
ncbi:MAG: dephospho-CoA kinase [Lentisphaeria bacterium]|nr:dephospho-CoA kinase [Lentisphaeria bacterium]